MTGHPAADLDALVRDLLQRHPVPGAGIGVLRDGRIETAFAGVTSLDDPLEVNARTLFQIGSISKTYTATTVLHLVTEGRVDLDRPVRTYVPELRLEDEVVAATVTVRQLLNHTSGWDGTLSSGSSDPDAPLQHFVDSTMPRLAQVSPLGHRAEYNNAAVALAGRLVEKVTGVAFEEAVRTALLEPLGLHGTHFSSEDLMTERVAVGHLADENGSYSVARPWRWPTAGNPEGGLVSTLVDQLEWARFHLGDGRASDGRRLLDSAALLGMQTPTVDLVGNEMGDAVGLGWFLRAVGGEATVGHQGTTNGQFAELRIVPRRGYAVVVCANGGPAGTRFTRDAVDTLLGRDLGIRAPRRRRRPYDPARDGDVTGTYQNTLARLTVSMSGEGVAIQFALRPGAAAEMGDPTFEPCVVQFLDGEHSQYVVMDGPFEGTAGSFERVAGGVVTEVSFGGRWHRRDEC